MKPREWILTGDVSWLDGDGARHFVHVDEELIAAIQSDAFTAGAEAQREACAVELERQVESGWYSTCPPGTAVRICPLVTLPKGET